ncbi:MAG: hypothetical protein WBX19_07910 [Terracidiphilus sp.]
MGSRSTVFVPAALAETHSLFRLDEFNSLNPLDHLVAELVLDAQAQWGGHSIPCPDIRNSHEHLTAARRGPPGNHAVAFGEHIFREDLGRGTAGE